MSAQIDWARWREAVRTPTRRGDDAYGHDRDETRSARHATTELQRAHPRHTPAGTRMDEPEDIRWDDA